MCDLYLKAQESPMAPSTPEAKDFRSTFDTMDSAFFLEEISGKINKQKPQKENLFDTVLVWF